MSQINVTSEYKKLKKVLLHRPGEETENLTPSTYEELLFDDAYYLKEAQKEHDEFAKVLKHNGVEIVYLEDLVAQTLDLDQQIKAKFIKEFIIEGKVTLESNFFPILENYFNSFSKTKEMVGKMMAGTRYDELPNVPQELKGEIELEVKKELFVLKPMPNLIFTRDPFSTIGNGISLHTMHYETRKRETLFAEYIFTYNPEYKDTIKYYDRNDTTSLEGGDVMILSDKEIAVGISQRTQVESIGKLAKNIFKDRNNTIDTIYEIEIPKGRSWMHLDTVFTQIDINKFAVFTDYDFTIFKVVKTDEEGNFKKEKFNSNIMELMKTVFNQEEVTLIYAGNNDPLAREREQWNDGSNVLAIAPNKIVTYDRNYVTNKALRDAGVKVIEISSYELSRGRGGPRCMSMPLVRDEN